MKRYTINFEDKAGNVFETHKTNNVMQMLNSIKMHDESGSMYQRYYFAALIIIDNKTGKRYVNSDAWYFAKFVAEVG